MTNLKWKVSLGSPFVESNIHLNNITLEETSILPGDDGCLYLANLEDNSVEKLDVSLKSLIEKSPFTLPMMKNSIFLGDKSSTYITIDVDEGIVLSKKFYNKTYSNLKEEFTVENFQKSLITVIRTDYTLSAFVQNTSYLQWNLTVSDIIIIEKQGKKELRYDQFFKINDELKKNEKHLQLIRNQKLENNLVTLYKYKQNLPFKLYWDIEKSIKVNGTINIAFNKYKESIKSIIRKVKKETKYALFVNSNYLNLYTILISLLSLFCLLASILYKKIKHDNNELNKQIKILKDKKFSDDLSNESTNSKLDKSSLEEKNIKNSNVVFNYDSNGNEYATIKNNFEGNYDEVIESKDFSNSISGDEENSYRKLLPNYDYKLEEVSNVNRSFRSNISSNSKTSGLEAVISEEDFNKKTKLPYMQEAIHLNYKKKDMSSVTECILEEHEYEIKKTEYRKIITIYDKSTQGILYHKPKSFDDKYNAQDTSIKNPNVKININARLTRKNLTYSLEKTDSGLIDDQIELESYLFRRNKSENNIIAQETYSPNEEDKNELLILKESYLKMTKSKLTFTNDDSIVKNNTISLSIRHNEIYKIINDSNIHDEDSSNKSFYNLNTPSEYDFSLKKEFFDTGRFIKNFEEIRVIGKGGFGYVFRARHKIDGSEYAVKIIKLKISSKENLSDQEVVKEIKTMMKLNNKNIVRYITCWFELNDNLEKNSNKNRSKSINNYKISNKNKNSCKYQRDTNSLLKGDKVDFDSENYNYSSIIFENISNNKIVSNEKFKIKDDTIINQNLKAKKYPKFTIYFYMQIEYCQGFPLNFYLESRKKGTDEGLIFYMFKQMVSALKEIHLHNIIHRDLKPANIFIHGYFLLKIGDFGLATFTNKSTSSEIKENVGTPLYQSPEQIDGKPYDEKVDIYSLGIILLELCCFFKTQSERRFVLENVRNKELIPLSIQEKYPEMFILIQMMTDRDPSKRLCTNEIFLSEPYNTLIKKYAIENDE